MTLRGDRLLRSQKCQLDQLLGDGAAARPREAAILHRVIERTQQPDRVHAGMFVEVRVLGGDRGVQQVGGNPVQRHRSTPAEVRIAHLVEHVPIPIVDQRRGEVAGARLQLVGHGQIPGDAGVAHQHDAERQHTQSHDDQRDEGRRSAARSPARRRLTRWRAGCRAHRLRGSLSRPSWLDRSDPAASAPAPRARHPDSRRRSLHLPSAGRDRFLARRDGWNSFRAGRRRRRRCRIVPRSRPAAPVLRVIGHMISPLPQIAAR